jgi:hypothetical protein
MSLIVLSELACTVIVVIWLVRFASAAAACWRS